MGLDMYLSKKTYIGAQYEHNKVKGVIDISRKVYIENEGEKKVKINIKLTSNSNE
jgi:hypothetical protein